MRRLLELRPRLNRRNGLLRARRNIAYHYDLGNELFELMLDETMTYSCAVFEQPEQSLADAQRAKYERLCNSSSSGPRITCSRSAAAGAASRTTPRRRAAAASPASRSRGEQAAFARAPRRRAGPVEIREQDYRTSRDGTRRSSRSRCSRRSARISSGSTSRRSTACSHAAAGRGADDPHPRGALGALPAHARLDRAVRVPRLPDPLARVTRARGGVELAPRDLRRRRDRRALRRDAPPLAGERPRAHRRGARTRVRPAVRAHVDFYLAFCEAAFRRRALRDVQLLLERAE